MTKTLRTTATIALLVAGTTLAATPPQNCGSGKNKEAGKYVECRHEAEAAFALTGDGARRTAALQTCAERHAFRWLALESRAAGLCPSTGDQVPIQHYLDTASTDVAAALAGAPLAGQARPLRTGCVAGCTVLTCSCGWNAGTGGSEIYWTSTGVRGTQSAVWSVAVYEGTSGTRCGRTCATCARYGEGPDATRVARRTVFTPSDCAANGKGTTVKCATQ